MFLAVSLASYPGMSFTSVSMGRAKHFLGQYISVDFSSKGAKLGFLAEFLAHLYPITTGNTVSVTIPQIQSQSRLCNQCLVSRCIVVKQQG